MIRGIVFDLDDTLYPSSEYFEGGIRAVARYAGEKYGIAPEEAYAYMRILYNRYGVREVLAKSVCHFGLDASAILELVSVFREHRPSLALYPGGRQMLQSLFDTYSLALLGDGEPEVQERKVAALRIRRFFKAVIFTGRFEESRGKPSPFCYNLVAQILRSAPQHLLYVGDNPLLDFSGARRAGYRTLRVIREDLAGQTFPVELDADDTIHALTDLERYLHELAL